MNGARNTKTTMKTIPISLFIGSLLMPTLCLGEVDPAAPGMKKHPKGDPEQGFRQMMEAWKAADSDGDGAISKTEFAGLERMKGLPEDKRDQIFGRLDKDGDGKITQEERGHFGRKDGHFKDEMKRRLWDLDVDKSGSVSLEEMKAGEFFMKLEPEKQEAVFQKLDTDGDGMITPKDRPNKEREGRDERPDHSLNMKLDADRNGSVSFEEFRKGEKIRELGEDEQEKRFQQRDTNGDGKLSPQDFSPPMGGEARKAE